MNNNEFKEIHRGFVSLEIIAVLVLILLGYLYGAEKYSQYLQEKEWHVAANQIQVFNAAAKEYIADNNDSILSGSLPLRVTPSFLKDKGFLSKNFSEINSFGQGYLTGIVKNNDSNSKSKLQALTCTVSGTAITEKGMRAIASEIQGLGGYISDKNIATGAYGGWSSKPSDFGLDCRHGHISIALSSEILGSVLQESDRLYRFKVNHKPDLNTMHTHIDMGKNDIKNINLLEANDAVFINTVMSKGNITSSSLVSGQYLFSSSTALSGAACNNNGLISKDSSGAILSCTNGVWAKGGTGVPVGTIAIWGASKFPDEWLELNGSTFDKNKYPELAKLFPSGYLPDFRGVFLRGLDRNRGLDSESGRGLLSFQNDAMQRIYGEMRTDGASTLATGPFKVLRRDGTEWSGGRGASHRFDFDSARVTRTAEETRVKNIAVIYIIKAR